MKLILKLGSTSNRVRVFIQDSTSTSGDGLTGLVYNSASLTAYYVRDGDATATSISLVTATVGTFASGGFVAVDGTNMPGLYEIGIPDAALSSGNSLIVMLKGATNMVPLLLEIELVAYDPQDAVHLGITGIPNAAAAAAGGLPVIGTGSGAINPSGGKVPATLAAADVSGDLPANVVTWLASAPAALTTSGYVQTALQRWLTDNAGGTPNALATGRVDASVGAYPGNTAQTGDSFARIGAAGAGLTAVALTSAERTAIANALLDLTDGIETGVTPRYSLMFIAAGIAGILAGADTDTVTIDAIGNAGTTRIVSTVDAFGNRSAVTLTP